jgi:hypothetical protein
LGLIVFQTRQKSRGNPGFLPRQFLISASAFDCFSKPERQRAAFFRSFGLIWGWFFKPEDRAG